MTLILPRRRFLAGLAATAFAAPAIVRASSLMPVKVFAPELVGVKAADLPAAVAMLKERAIEPISGGSIIGYWAFGATWGRIISMDVAGAQYGGAGL